MGAELIKARGAGKAGAAVRPSSAPVSRALRSAEGQGGRLSERGPGTSAPAGRPEEEKEEEKAARGSPRVSHGAPVPGPPHRPIAPRRPHGPGRALGPPAMEPHVLGAVLYWLLLPCALLAGEWGAGAGGQWEGAASRLPTAWTPDDAGRGEGCGRARRFPGTRDPGARIPEA